MRGVRIRLREEAGARAGGVEEGDLRSVDDFEWLFAYGAGRWWWFGHFDEWKLSVLSAFMAISGLVVPFMAVSDGLSKPGITGME